LYDIAKMGGVRPEDRVEKLRAIAHLAEEEFGGDLNVVLGQPSATAKRGLQRFPGIGAPGAERILMHTHETSAAEPALIASYIRAISTVELFDVPPALGLDGDRPVRQIRCHPERILSVGRPAEQKTRPIARPRGMSCHLHFGRGDAHGCAAVGCDYPNAPFAIDVRGIRDPE